jgi:hypothetical protein
MGLNQIVLLAAQVKERSLGDRIGKALSDSAMSIIIVFLVLILISIIISGFRLINKYEANLKGMKDTKEASPKIDVVPANSSQLETKELVDDLELVAVITAAIYAYEEACGNTVPENGLFVRSIKKVNTKWRNA